jgi:HD-GYP domain-containing protein (c-di-GMP phosphodiesterase class II)
MLPELTEAVEGSHPWTRGHARRVAGLALSVAERLEWGEARLRAVRAGSLLHDVGKLLLPTELLGKPGALTAAEFDEVCTHPAAGARLIVGTPEARDALGCVLYHHERWDGLGYPARLDGSLIPIEARLVGLADAFDAMTSTRPYRAALTADAALAELMHCAGTQFDPLLTEACVEIWSTRALLVAAG